jgi:hypothetical protein
MKNVPTIYFFYISMIFTIILVLISLISEYTERKYILKIRPFYINLKVIFIMIMNILSLAFFSLWILIFLIRYFS